MKKYNLFTLAKIMKQYSLSLLTTVIVIVVLFFTSACSRKVGCYWSQVPELKVKSEVAAVVVDPCPSPEIQENNPVVALTTVSVED